MKNKICKVVDIDIDGKIKMTYLRWGEVDE